LKRECIVGIVAMMKYIALMVTMVSLSASSACKHKDETAAPAASVSAAAPGPGALPLPSTPSVVSDFEGELSLVARGKFAEKEANSLTLLIKGDRVRVDLPETLTAARGLGPVRLLALPGEKKAYAILDAKKQAVLLELDKLAEQAKSFGARPRPGAPAAPAAPRLQKTGKFDSVAGIKCEIWHFDQGKSEGDACIAEQETSWLRLPSVGTSPADLSWLTPIADGKHFPLRFVAIEQGVERGRVEVTSVQKKSLQASQFELPADYAVLSLEQMIGAMLGGLGGLGGPGVQLPRGLKLPPGVKLPPDPKSPPPGK